MNQIREALEEAYSSVEKNEEKPAATPAETPSATGEQAQASPVETPETPAVVKSERERDTTGKFTKKTGTPVVDTPAAPGEQKSQSDEGTEEIPAAAAPTTHKAPTSWKPAAREYWGKVPVEVQEEILRREADVARGLTQSSNARNFYEQFSKVVAPFEHMMRAENSTPLQAVDNLMKTAALFRVGTQQQKAAKVAEIIRNFSVDIPTLDALLSGQQVDPEEDKVARIIEQRMAPVNALLNEFRQTKQQHQQQFQSSIAEELDSFANDPANEFYNEVSDDMADLLASYARNGRALSLQDAYKKAISLHPEVSQILEQRKLAEQRGRNAAELARSKAAAGVGVTGSPTNSAVPGSGDNSLRGAIDAAINRLQS